MLTQEQIENVPGTDVHSTDGTKIGRAGTVYIADETGRPEWATVHTGLFGMRESFVPLAQAELRDDRVVVPYDKEQVKDAPNVDPDGGHLSLLEEQRLYDHYGVPFATREAETSDFVAFSKDRLNVARRDESGRVRLRRHVMTEQPGGRVPASDGEARVERGPVTYVNRRDSVTGVNRVAPLIERDISLDGDDGRRNR